ncbi:MAG: serine/threonine-protein kinase [Hyalangium sp.]|uniref:serine/threonine-protein kinase n=1 Tax=Hyalangium sp. TaxID=2028555 RepID=UPI00389A8F2C
MERTRAPELHPALIPLGTVVGRWRVVAWAGCGMYGAVYRAVPVDAEQADSVALKVALLPRDPRFTREVELLSRTQHPSVPRLLDSGEWQHPFGSLHPFIVMEWVGGPPLYDWAWEHNPRSQQVLRMLAQLARALEALHAQGAVHRDLKGDNILVRRSDSRALLSDFGSGIYPGASRLTPPNLFPGTPVYRAPESWLFELRFMREASARYSAGPADDLYSLGVTAYRLVTGQYPEFGGHFQDATGTWQLGALASPAPLVLNPRVHPRLDALILRMLSMRPEERGTAASLAEALEEAAEQLSPQSDQPLFARQAPPPAALPPEEVPFSSESRQPRAPAERAAAKGSGPRERLARLDVLRTHVRRWVPWLSVAVVGLTLIAWAWWATRGRTMDTSTHSRTEARSEDRPDAGPVGLGNAASTTSVVRTPEGSVPEMMAEDTLPDPLPGQTRPDDKGRCPRKEQLAINGGCWALIPLGREECEGNGYVFTTRCYGPVLSHPRKHQPTSHPGRQP